MAMRPMRRGPVSKLLAAACIAAISLICSCASGPDYQRVISNAYAGGKQPDRLNSELIRRAVTAGARASASEYRIGPDDLLEISVFQIEELKSTVRVSRTGTITLPLVNDVRAGGRTTTELASAIAMKYREYLIDPVVTVFVKQYSSYKITVLGAVSHPQVFSVSGQKDLLDMLSMAGGLTENASNICVIQEAGAESGKPGTIRIDLNELLVKGRADLDIPLASGDVVTVPEAGRFFVDGAVGEPGAFRLKGGTTLTQAISMAKGLNFEAVKTVRIYRDAGGGRRRLISVNYDSIMNGKSPDVYIRDKDVIFVPKNGLKALLKSLRGTVYTGSVAVGRGGF